MGQKTAKQSRVRAGRIPEDRAVLANRSLHTPSIFTVKDHRAKNDGLSDGTTSCGGGDHDGGYEVEVDDRHGR